MQFSFFAAAALALFNGVSGQDQQGCCDILAVDAISAANTWSVVAAMWSPYEVNNSTGSYCDLVEVRSYADDGTFTVLGSRDLIQPHPTEQPFERAMNDIVLADASKSIVVIASDSVSGFCGRSLSLTLKEGSPSAVTATPASTPTPVIAVTVAPSTDPMVVYETPDMVATMAPVTTMEPVTTAPSANSEVSSKNSIVPTMTPSALLPTPVIAVTVAPSIDPMMVYETPDMVATMEPVTTAPSANSEVSSKDSMLPSMTPSALPSSVPSMFPSMSPSMVPSDVPSESSLFNGGNAAPIKTSASFIMSVVTAAASATLVSTLML